MSRVNITVSEKSEFVQEASITYGIAETQFGNFFVALNKNMICEACFTDDDKATSALANLKKDWSNSTFAEDNDKISDICTKIFDENNEEPLNVQLIGTDFQVSVWKELRNIKKGSKVSYEDVAVALGNPKAIRAVATAVSKNRIGFIIPCHRVISKTGGLGKYKWGAGYKLKLLKYEGAI